MCKNTCQPGIRVNSGLLLLNGVGFAAEKIYLSVEVIIVKSPVTTGEYIHSMSQACTTGRPA